MTIKEEMIAVFANTKIGTIFSRDEIITIVYNKFGRNKSSIIPTDFCYNRYNNGLDFGKHMPIFEYTYDKRFKYLGEKYPYTGLVFHKPKGKNEVCIGKMIDGIPKINNISDTSKPTLHKKCNIKYSTKMDKHINIRALWNSNVKRDWENALNNFWNLVRPENIELEKELNSLEVNRVKEMNAKEFYNFLYDKYFVSKYTAKNRLATTRKQLSKYKEQGKLVELASIHKEIFNPNTRSIETVKKIHGLGVAGASGLLSILFPESYGTVDQFIIYALRETDEYKDDITIAKMNPLSIKTSEGEYLECILRKKARELNSQFNTTEWTPRKIDMILWSVGR